jgi:hypothetical protein
MAHRAVARGSQSSAPAGAMRTVPEKVHRSPPALEPLGGLSAGHGPTITFSTSTLPSMILNKH